MILFSMMGKQRRCNLNRHSRDTNFPVLGFSAVRGSAFGLALQRFSTGQSLMLQTYHEADLVGGGSLVLALFLMLFLPETMAAARPTPKAAIAPR